MKESKAVYVTKRDIKLELKREYQFYGNNITRDREYSPESTRYDQKTYEVGCQYDSKRDNLICTCKNLATLKKRQEVRYFGLPNQIYAYHGSKSYTDIGVGSVKALQRKKVKKIYLPETDDRGVGSSDLSSFILRRNRQHRGNSYYDNKRTSSKCVGGILEYNTGCVMNEKLSPIVQTISGSTSPRESRLNRNIEIGSNTVVKSLANTTTQVEEANKRDTETKPEIKVEEIIQPIILIQEEPKDMKAKKEDSHKPMERKDKPAEKVYSSDSLEQHVHNLENPSDDKQSRFSVDTEDPMENKLEREYRKIFAAKSKSRDSKPTSERPVPDFKSTSTLKRRFEALRRGLAKKEDSKKNAVIVNKVSSQNSAPSRKDVSINSDPPSLEGRSYSNTKTYSPFPPSYSRDKTVYHPRTSHYRRSVTGNKKERGSAQWSSRPDDDDSECQGVKGMFKLWGKKFNLEEDQYKRRCTPMPSYHSKRNTTKKIEESKVEIKTDAEVEKKEGRKFFFFKKKNKEKTYKPKKGVTAGRCEVRDGLMIKIGGNAFAQEDVVVEPEEPEEPEPVADDYEEMIRRAWLKKFLTRSIESRNSVQVRWNNKTYAPSSSTVFELMDTVYKDTGVIFRSKSQVTAKSSYKSYTKQHVNFVHQNIEAWMIPKTLTDKPKLLPVKLKCKSDEDRKDNIEVRISDQKWFIDKSKAFSHKIEVVLHSKNFNKLNKAESSDYLRIDIPKGFFVDSSSDDNKNPNTQSSDEEVYKIVEYETASDLKKQKARNYDTGDYKQNNINVTVSVKESKDGVKKILEAKKPPVNRDVVIQGSNVNIPKRCDVIGVGIITQRDLREIRKPILKIQDDYSDDESEHNILKTPQKKCEFAESYLQEYYRHWTPLGMDLYSWCVSDSHLRCCSENSKTSFNNQGDGTKSCPNIFDDFQASTIVSSCGASSCSQCHTHDENEKPPEKTSWFGKFKKKSKDPSLKKDGFRRMLPKDSVEVFKRRKIYAASMKSKWVGPCPDFDQPYSVPSNESKSAQNTLTECPKLMKSCCKPIEPRPRRKTCKKHVSLPDCDTMNEMLAKQLADVMPEGILAFKGGSSGCEVCKRKGTCPKHAKVNPKPSCEIPRPPCRDSCEKMKKPPCADSKVSCDKPPSCPGATPSRPPSCPPTPPPCKRTPSCPATPPCKRTPSCPATPPCKKPPSCPPTPCKKPPSCPPTPPSCPPTPPPCKKKKSPPPCPSPPPPCPPSPPKCKKPPSCPPTPPPSCKTKAPCPPSPPPCRKKPPCPSSPPPCKKPPPPCPPSPPPCKKPPSCPPTPPCRKPTCPPTSPPCKKPPPCPPSPPPCRKPPTCPPTPPPCKRQPRSPPSCPHIRVATCPSSPPSCRHSPPPPCPYATPPCPHSPSTCPHGPPPCPHHPPPCPHTPSCPATPPCYPPPPPPPCQRPPSCPHTPPCTPPPPPCYRSNKPCPLAPPSCPTSPPSCCSADPDRCPAIPPPCKKASSNICKKLSPFFRRKTIMCPGSPPCKPTPCKPSFCKPLACQPSPCEMPRTCVPSPCQKFSTTSCSYGSLHPTPDAPFFYSPIHPCPPEPEKPKKITAPCDSSPCNKRHPKYKPPPFECKDSNPVKPYAEPQCDQCRTDIQQGDDFPWPTKNQVSNQSSVTSLYHATNAPETLAYGECKKDCPMLPKMSCETIPSPKKECKQSCPNKQGSPRPPCIPEMQCPPPKPPSPPPEPPKTPAPEAVKCRSKSRMSGLFLKMKPVGKKKSTCSKDCLAWDSTHREDGCISLNSEEKITIRLKKETPSTTEIREGLNIKVQDEDGMTLFERKDYRLQHADCSIQRPSLLGEVYKASEVRRVTTNNSVQAICGDKDCRNEISEVQSDASIANLIEIQFKLKVTQGEKTTEINIANDGDKENEPEEKIEHSEGMNKMPQEVFIMKDGGERLMDHSDQKNDINIRIVIKNFKPKSGKKKSVNVNHDDYSKQFSKKISAKFHTVSTGYSDVLHDDNVFSVHRATVDLTSSIDKSKTHSNRSEEMMSEPLLELGRGLLMGSSEPSICRCITTDMSEGKSEDTEAKSLPSQKYSATKDIQETLDETDTEKLTDHKYEYTEETDTEKPIKYDTEETDTEKQVEPKYDTETDTEKHTEQKYDTFMSTDTDELDTLPEIKKSKSIEVIVKPHTKDEKKEMLKQVFEKAHETKSKNKTRMRKLRDMLKVILTSDSSDHDDAKPPPSDLAKDVTYASLKPNYFRHSDSMNNYYRESNTVLTEGEINRQVIYPSVENNSECSNSNQSEVLSSENESPKCGGCMCSTVAARLKLASRIGEGGGCCCGPKPPTKKNEETTCDLKRESDYFQYDYKTTDYVDVETQNSRYLTSKINSTNLSVHKSLRTSVDASINIEEEVKSNSGVINVNDRHFSTRKSFSPHMNHVRECEMRKLNKNTMLSISDEDKIVLLSGHSTKFNTDSYRLKDRKKNINYPLTMIQASDILQSYETKKAVLEIYTEKTVSDEGERLVAKLPKFVYDRENEIQTNYEAMATNTYKTVCKKNIVMMAINR